MRTMYVCTLLLLRLLWPLTLKFNYIFFVKFHHQSWHIFAFCYLSCSITFSKLLLPVFKRIRLHFCHRFPMKWGIPGEFVFFKWVLRAKCDLASNIKDLFCFIYFFNKKIFAISNVTLKIMSGTSPLDGFMVNYFVKWVSNSFDVEEIIKSLNTVNMFFEKK